MKLDFEQGLIQIDGRAGYLNSGEFHYFRVPYSQWRTRLKLLRDSGANALATYIPWLIHEPEEGVFAFEEKQIHLRNFLDLAAETGLQVIARPGPYQYSELLYGGLPGWLCQKYPEILALDRKGRRLNYFSVSYLHPLFLEKVERYFARVCPILAEYSATRGGPVAWVQADNELGGIHAWMGDFDFHPESMGFGREGGRYARFLQARSSSLEGVNRRYGTSHATWGAFSPADEPQGGTAGLLWQRDYADFYCETLGEYLEILIGMMKKYGIDVPFCHNSANPNMNTWFREAKARLKDQLWLGSDHYYTLSQSCLQNNPTPQYALRCFCSLEELRLMKNPACVFEFPFGSLSDWPPIAAEDLTACLLLHQAFGLRGHNGYIFTGGPNWPGTGMTGDVYDYGAPIGSEGEIRPTYAALKQFDATLAQHPEWAESELVPDFRILFPWELARVSPAWGKAEIEPDICPGELWSEFRQGLVTSAFAKGLLPEFVDPDEEGFVADTGTPLVVFTDGSMAQSRQERLIRFLENGGSAVIMPVIPRWDESYQSCTLLADYLGGARSGRGVTPHDNPSRLEIGGVANLFATGNYFPATTIPVGAEVIGQEVLSGTPVAWRQGRVIALGMSWKHSKTEHAQMLYALLSQLGLREHVRSDNPWLLTVLRRHREGATLFVMNLSTAAHKTHLAVRPTESWHFFGSQTLAAMTVLALPVPMEMLG